MVTDGGPPFASQELKTYFDRNAIVHSRTSPYRPKGNGAAENAVRTVKNCIKKSYSEGGDVAQAISKMLFQYRNCEHATTGVAPAVALLGRRLRGRLDVLRPSTEERVRDKQRAQVERAGGSLREARPGDTVYVRDYGKSNEKWVEGQIQNRVGPNSFSVALPNASNAVRRHIDQMLIPKPVKKRYSLSATPMVALGDRETNVVNNDVNDGVVASSSSAVTPPKASPKRSAVPEGVPSPGDGQFEMARSSPEPATPQPCSRLRPRLHKPSYKKYL